MDDITVKLRDSDRHLLWKKDLVRYEAANEIEKLRAENARLRAELAALSPPQPGADWRERCVVKQRLYGWDATTHNGEWWTDGEAWFRQYEDDANVVRGFFIAEHIARQALAACSTPPPGSAQ